ncbi:chalcone isomerase family protein [Paraherbaspirillum soli]|uniref:Chalcone isomerase family protein n=1 Tax=Paraherbaspirillum soli TaxID=631222 RepID=A0ABW0ME06_9BURK
MKALTYLKRTLACACVLSALTLSQSGMALDLAGVKIDETARVGNQDLKLNGAGIRYKAVFKVYTAALYLTEKKTTVPDVLAVPGPRRVELVMLRDVSSEDFSRAFIKGIHNNSDKTEKAKIANQLQKFGELFSKILELKKGDVLITDWIPGTGTQFSINGKMMSDVLPDLAFYNALLKIWLGDSPADFNLKSQMLGQAAS